MGTMTSPQRLLICSGLFSLYTVNAVPYMLLENSRPKCITLMSPRETRLTIHYDAPDLIVIPGGGEEEEPEKEIERVDGEANVEGADGMDKMYEERQKRRMEQMKRQAAEKRKLADMSISVSQKGDSARGNWKRRFNRGTGRMREEIWDKTGSLEFDTAGDGHVEICMQSRSAFPGSPSRIALTITKLPLEPEQEMEHVAHVHLTKMEGTLMGMKSKIDMILKQADSAKDAESSFHSKTIELQNSCMFWPQIHIVALVATGFVQVQLLVKFFKDMHLVY